MSAIWAAIKDVVYSLVLKTNFTSILTSALSGLGGFWGSLAAFILKPFASSIEQTIDKDISDDQAAEKSDASIDAAAAAHTAEMQKAKTNDELNQAADDSMR